MSNFDKLKQLDTTDFAYTVCIDNLGECRGVCAICQRHIEGNCDDRCIYGVKQWLESEGADELHN